ncbi:hypothetical protein F0562_033919 [Nyssa sinensis]|uniref:Uncharacterized protein n=1 Tax=Nyssa sinensis TaxID=561372 RepID=A0A5J5AHD8_9ASTE|nr:hypothetical protein F0562_033919 [Nyssa sinensis]
MHPIKPLKRERNIMNQMLFSNINELEVKPKPKGYCKILVSAAFSSFVNVFQAVPMMELSFTHEIKQYE